MLGSRGIWHEGWKAVAEHGPTSGMSGFDRDTWQLFHTDEDRAEAQDLAEQHPQKLEELKALWLEEAKAKQRPAAERPPDPRRSEGLRDAHHEFTGGTIVKVVFDIADDADVDVERHLAAAMMRD
jgi:hypothetical protein